MTAPLRGTAKYFAIIVIDEPRTPRGYVQVRVEREVEESPEAFADRVRARVVEVITKPGRR